MKPFALNTVLNYRKRLEEIAQHRLFEAEKNATLIEQTLQREKNLLKKQVETSNKLQAKGIDITELIRYEQMIYKIKDNIAAIQKKLFEKKNILREERENLILRSKQRQIMEQLKLRQNKNWSSYLNKKEAAMLDEIAIIRHEKTSSKQNSEL